MCHSLGKLDPDYVDAYFGPENLKSQADSLNDDLRSIKVKNIDLKRKIEELVKDSSDIQFRAAFIEKMLTAMNQRINILLGYEPSFEVEAETIYRATPPKYDSSHFQSILSELDKELSGEGDLNQRYNKFKNQFIVPNNLVDTVFKAALAKSRSITNQYFDLPVNEDFILEYVYDKPWSGYNWFQGNSQSIVQINLDQPIFIDRAIDLAAHEAYPGHHVYHSLIENKFVKKNNWLEFTVYPLYSPLSLISEGAANFGIEMVFPGEKKIEFEKEILYPLAKLDSSKADKYNKVQQLISKLNFAGNEAAREFLNGNFDEEQTIDYLMKYSLMTKSRAEQRLNFIKKYRAYVINYNVGLFQVRTWINMNSSTEKERWKNFKTLIENVYLADDISTTNLVRPTTNP